MDDIEDKEEGSMSLVIVVAVILVAVAVYFIVIYNRFVSLRMGADAAWSDIDVQLKRRYDLIPALVDLIKEYKEYEATTLNEIVKARQQGLDAATIKEKEKAEKMLKGAIGNIFALVEAYPDLKANTTFLKLQNELSAIEDAIQNARRYYNAVVRDFNTRIESFPDLLIARKFNFEPREYFQLDEEESDEANKAVRVKL